jgi:RNA polymerase sigma-70 factor (ECF subfamily)
MDGPPTEQTLMEQAQRGDRAAFAQIVHQHQGAVYGYLRARLLQPNDAEDLTQEVFLRCYLARARFDSTNQMRPWLLGIARNILREHVRKLKRRKEVAWTELCLELEELAPPAEDQRYDEFVGQLPQCLGGLGQSARQALDMHYASRLRLAQISEQLKRSEGAVKLLLYRARQALKRCLDGSGQAKGTKEPF